MSERAESSGTTFWEDADDTEALHRYRTLVDAIDDGIYQLNADGQFVAVNDVIVEITGYAREDLLNEHVSVLCDDGNSATERDIERRLANPPDRGELLEVTVKTAEGKHVPCEVRVSRIETDGTTQGAVGIVRDVSERNRTVQAVSERDHRGERTIERQRVITALEAAREGISLLDENGEFVYVNDAYANTFGYDPEEMIDKHWDALGIEAEPDRFHGEILPRIADEDQWTGTTTCVRSDDSTFPAQHSLTSTENDELICVIRDVTDRTERERELARYERIVENLPVGVYRNTPGIDGEFVAGNERLASIFDVDSVDELLEYNVSDLYADPGQRAEFSRQLEREGRVEDFELKQETVAGETIWISVTAIRTEEDGDVYFDGIVQDVTERRKREQELEARSAAMEESIDGIAILNENEEYTFANQAHAEIYGYDGPEAFIGETWRLCYDDEELNRLETEALPGLLEEGSWRGEATGMRKDGSTFPQELSLTVLDDGRHICIVRDVTEQRERERELERYETLFRESRDVNGVLAPDGTFEYLTPSATGVLGYDPEELVGENAFDYVHPEDRERVAETYTEMVENPEREPTVEYRFEHADGSWIVLESRGRNLLDEPNVEGIVVYSRDVTERKEREQNLRETREQLEVATTAGSVGVWTWNIQDDALTADEYLAETYGMDPEEAASGAPIEAFFEPMDEEDRERVWQKLDEAVEETGEFEAEYRVRDADDDTTWVVSRAEVEYDDGDPIRMHGAISDITERKRREQLLAEQTELLERIASGASLEECLSELCAAVPRLNPGVRASIVFADDERESLEQPIAPDLSQSWDEGLEGAPINDLMIGTCGAAVFRGEPITCEDIRNDDRWSKEWRDVCIDNGVLAGHSEPILDADGEPEGSFMLCFDEPREPNEWERRLIDFGTHIASVALDRDRSRQALRENEERLRLATEAAEMGVWELDLQTEDSLDHSPQHDEIFGYEERDEWSVETFLDHVHPDDRERIAQSFEDAFEAGEWTFECRIIRADDEQRWIAAQGEFYYDESEPVRAVGTVQDITEQKEQERYLHDAKSRLEAATEAGAVGTWEWHIPEDRMVVGPSFARTFGINPEVAREGVPLGQFVSAIHEADRERVERKLEEAVESCGEYEAEYRVWNADDELRWVVARGHVECDGDGNPVTFPGALTDITQRKVSQRKIEESERRYRTLVENFPNGAVGLFDETLRYTAVGGQFLDEANIPKEERIGNSVYDIYPAELIDEIEPNFRAALSGEMNSFEVTYHGRHLLAHTLPVRNDDDEVFAGMLVVQDVTERREAQRELRESEAKFRMIAENLEEIVWMATPDAEEFIYLNPAFEEVWGLDREELYDEPLSFLEAVHPDDRARVREEFAALPDSEFDEEFRIARPDDEIRWVHARGTRVRDEDGEIVRVVGVGEDVTERKERERALEESERRYRTLAENFPNGAVSVYDDDLRYTLAAGDKVGDPLPSAAEAEGMRMQELYPDDIVADLEPMFRAAIEDGETGSIQTTVAGLHWQVWATPLRDGDGDIFAGLSFAQDITKRVEREQRLEELIDKLETSNERLEQFAYAASHDLQEPLRMVSSYLQLIEQRYADELDEDGEEFIEFAVDGADRMRSMIEGLLKYSRVETRGDQFEPVDLDAVLTDVRADLQVSIQESDAEITADSLPRVDGDEGQLRQVFQNLLDNAIDYSGDEPPQIDISARRQSGEWVISVCDQGIGIDAHDADRVFEVFESLHTLDDRSGTGIGLALCERIVERHGGDIWVDSEPGEGATFSFTLPVAGEREE